ncbi:unnamed protein product, partial [Mesorhabditis belari]|uniref:Phospholysine phosphohistidine inorganic pyrophosphate phosphatase n=1 Tax=Mesorhabditis belari TaxID=2138241 RepID=A0AAF3EDE8_9BILA
MNRFLRPGPIRGFLLDITGVLYNSAEGSDGITISGSVDAVNRLYKESRVRFLSNESTHTTEKVVAKLTRLGFTLQQSDVITPAPVAADYLKERDLHPHLLLHPGVSSYFPTSSREANCVLLGDAEHEFSFHNVNMAFRALMKMKRPLLLSLGQGRFYQQTDGPTIDIGAYAEALKYASGCEHVVIGKPSPEYFQYALDQLGCSSEETVMIGDDIISDVGGAQKFGMRAIQVRTGKWRNEWEKHPIVSPDLIVDCLAVAVNSILDAQQKQ